MIYVSPAWKSEREQIISQNFPKIQMARQTVEANLQTPTARQRLSPRPEPYYRAVGQGLALGYRRGKSGGTWLARIRDPNRDSYREIKLGRADDPPARADNVATFAYDQALQRAREVHAREEARRISGVAPGAEKKSLNEIFDFYIAGYISGDAPRGKKPGRDLTNVKSILNCHIRPALGDVRVNQLNSELLENFKRSLACSPRLGRSRRPIAADMKSKEDLNAQSQPDEVLGQMTELDLEYQRKRRARANRIMTVVRAALNYALARKLITTDVAWRFALAPFADVERATLRYLSLDECRRLLSALDADFRVLVEGALMTGARYGSLRHVKVNDIDLRARTALLRITKPGKRQIVHLNEAACLLMRNLIEGKGPDDYVFVKASGAGWRPSDQIRRMNAACASAKISPPIGFHGLRDTFASHLAMGGANVLTISKLLGHSDIRTTQKYYAHLAESYLRQELEEKLPDFSHEPTLSLISAGRYERARRDQRQIKSEQREIKQPRRG